MAMMRVRMTNSGCCDVKGCSPMKVRNSNGILGDENAARRVLDRSLKSVADVKTPASGLTHDKAPDYDANPIVTLKLMLAELAFQGPEYKPNPIPHPESSVARISSEASNGKSEPN